MTYCERFSIKSKMQSGTKDYSKQISGLHDVGNLSTHLAMSISQLLVQGAVAVLCFVQLRLQLISASLRSC